MGSAGATRTDWNPFVDGKRVLNGAVIEGEHAMEGDDKELDLFCY